MSALAKILHGQGHLVTGSDQRAGVTLDLLSALGITVWEGHRPERLTGVDLVVASSAVPEDDLELRAAAEAGIPIWRRPRLLKEITTEIPTIGPTGTHGKTTTTALMISALRAYGADPSFVIGGDLLDLGTNAHLGSDELLILEIDEAFGTFEHVRLSGLVVTNVEPDHLDHFGSADELEESFVRVARGVSGPVVACVDDPGSARVAERVGAKTYGLAPHADWRMLDLVSHQSGSSFRLRRNGTDVPVTLNRPGVHLARNAAGALALLAEVGYDVSQAVAGVSRFAGVRRRFENRGTINGVRIIDDYAHHPTEVAATLNEARQMGVERVWAVFQPHLYSRTRDMHPEFGAALAQADAVVVTDVYGARETPIPGVTGDLVAAAARRAGARQVDYVAHRGDLAIFIADRVEPGDVVVTMGAGDIGLVPMELAAELGRSDERLG